MLYTEQSAEQLDIAVLIPCHNEDAAISSVVRAFHVHLPDAQVFVYDNNSSDDTAAFAAIAGAIVRTESQQGKGHVVRYMWTTCSSGCLKFPQRLSIADRPRSVADIASRNAPLFGALTLADAIPDGFRLVDELRVKDDRDFTCSRLFDVLRDESRV